MKDFYEQLGDRANEIMDTKPELMGRDSISQLMALFRALAERVEKLEKESREKQN